VAIAFLCTVLNICLHRSEHGREIGRQTNVIP
jgi:hypothetical protein